jgi:hypothetical protein
LFPFQYLVRRAFRRHHQRKRPENDWFFVLRALPFFPQRGAVRIVLIRHQPRKILLLLQEKSWVFVQSDAIA